MRFETEEDKRAWAIEQAIANGVSAFDLLEQAERILSFLKTGKAGEEEAEACGAH